MLSMLNYYHCYAGDDYPLNNDNNSLSVFVPKYRMHVKITHKLLANNVSIYGKHKSRRRYALRVR